jgi:hypothetical protein
MPLLPETSVSIEPIHYWKPLGGAIGRPGPSRGGEGSGPGRQVAKSCLPMTYRNKGKRWCGLLPSLVLFKLVGPPLQSGVVGSYLVQGVWFSSHLLLEGTCCIQNFGP